MTTVQSDPRSIITPDAFSVSGELVGLPLAKPGRRLGAMALDLVFIGILSQAGGILLGLAMALGLFRLATRRRENDPFRKLFRLTLGCVGAFALFVTFTVFVGLRVFGGGDREITSTLSLPTASGVDLAASMDGVGGLLGGMTELAALRSADSEDEALEAATVLGRRLAAGGLSRGDLRDVLAEAMPEDAPWRDDLPGRVVALLDSETEESEAPPGAVDAAAAEMTPEEALNRYSELLAAGPDALETDEADAVRARLLTEVAADTIAELQDEIADLEEDYADEQARTEQLESDLAAAQEVGGVESFVRFILDDLGLAFGWGTVYMSVFLAWWKGQTPGKRLVGVRVMRLDGGPITGWIAFERAGGYAAGFATGMLGFAQVFWDSNRQAIHDKIVGTVVVRTGQATVPGPWMAEVGAGR